MPKLKNLKTKFPRITPVNISMAIVAIVVLALINLGDYLLWFNLSATDKINSSVLFITAIAIIFYTNETYELKKIQQKQFEFENRPFFRVMWSNREDEIFDIRNQGKGIAIDVTFEPFELREGPLHTSIIIKRRPSYSAGGGSQVKVKEIIENSGRDSRFNMRGYIDTKLKGKKFPKLQMRYLDQLDNIYEAIFEPDETYNDRFKVVSQSVIGKVDKK